MKWKLKDRMLCLVLVVLASSLQACQANQEITVFRLLRDMVMCGLVVPLLKATRGWGTLPALNCCIRLMSPSHTLRRICRLSHLPVKR